MPVEISGSSQNFGSIEELGGETSSFCMIGAAAPDLSKLTEGVVTISLVSGIRFSNETLLTYVLSVSLR